MAVLAAFVILNVFLDLDAFAQVAYIKKLRVLHSEVLENVAPLEAGECRLHLCLVSEDHPGLRVLAMLQVLLEDIMLLQWHFLVANWAHVVIEAVVNVGTIRVHQA